jgi:putative ABC transport system substrate-binding protein
MTPKPEGHMASYIRRRKFLATLLGCVAAAWPLAARAQQRGLPVIGVLSNRSPATDIPLMAVIRRGLSETGFIEGQNVVFDYRHAEGQYDRLPALAADLVSRQVTLIITMGGELSALAAKAATATVPIVSILGTDGVRTGLVASVSRLGGHLTGVSSSLVELEPKKLAPLPLSRRLSTSPRQRRAASACRGSAQALARIS